MPRLALALLGTPQIESGGAPFEVDTRKATAMLVYLALTGTPHSRDSLAALFWPDLEPARAHGALRRTLSVLNKSLGGEGLNIDRESVSLEMGPEVSVDVAEFRRRLGQTTGHGHRPQDVCPDCLPLLAQAVELYRGDFLAGFSLRDSPAFDDWQFFQSETLKRELAGALEKLARGHAAAGALDPAIDYARRWLALDPLHEPAHRHLMSLYARSGQRAAALRQYRECVRVLDEELGVAPLEETTALYEAIKEQRRLGADELGGVGAWEPGSLGAGERGSRGAGVDLPRTAAPMPPSTSPLPLVGRSAEWAALLEAYAAIQDGGRWLVLEGEAGIGKTRLAETALAHIRDQGASVAAARCYEGEMQLAYGPFVEALHSALGQADSTARLAGLAAHFAAEAARLLPELAELRPDTPAPLPLDSPGAQSRFFEGVTQTLAALLAPAPGLPPGVLFVDDLHWADEASLDLLTYLVRRLPGRPLFVLASWRGEQVPAGHRLRGLLAEAQRAGRGSLLALDRLDLGEVGELVRSALARSSDGAPSGLAERLYQETEGLPFFVVEYLATLAHQPADAQDWALPGGARALLESRLAAVSETGRQLLSTAAIIGRSFDFDTLQEVSGRSDEETVTGLEALLGHGLVHEVTDGADGLIYDFNHERLRALAYEETSLARRRLLHRRVAETLARRARGGPAALGPLASQIAQHYRLGGRETEAAEYFRLAGDHARALYANAEALAHFATALGLGHPDAPGLHEAIGDLQTLAGDYPGALASYEKAAALSAKDAGRLAAVEHKLGSVHDRRGDWELAESHFQSALASLGTDGSEGTRARVSADWSLAAHRRGDSQRALDLAQQALELAEAAGDRRALAQVHNLLGMLAGSAHDLAQARHHLEHSLSLADELGDRAARAAALNNLALTLGASAQWAEALRLAEDALAVCVALGDRHREAALHNNLADLLHASGRSEDAMGHLKQAVAIFAEIGGEPGAAQPEIWKLTEW